MFTCLVSKYFHQACTSTTYTLRHHLYSAQSRDYADEQKNFSRHHSTQGQITLSRHALAIMNNSFFQRPILLLDNIYINRFMAN